MNLVAVEGPPTGIALPRKSDELFDTLLIVRGEELKQTLTDKLVQALAERFGFPASASDQLFVNR
jgi:hypothetical protein